jgi:hypothetical protein
LPDEFGNLGLCMWKEKVKSIHWDKSFTYFLYLIALVFTSLEIIIPEILTQNKVLEISITMYFVTMFTPYIITILPAEDKRPEIISIRNSEAKRHHKREGLEEGTDR